MAYLRLHDLRDDSRLEFDQAVQVRIGRDPSAELAITGPGSEVVSSLHAGIVHRDGAWWLEDRGGRNGTFLGAERVAAGAPVRLEAGAEFRLGQAGPRFRVEAVARRIVAETVAEPPRRPATVVEVDADATVPMEGLPAPPPPPAPAPPPPAPPPPPPASSLVLRHAGSGQTYTAALGRVRLGRGRECEIRPVEAGDEAVSRVHAELVTRADGSTVLRDARSRNGTLLNGTHVEGERPIAVGDRIRLGERGPELIVQELSGTTAAAPPAASPPPPPARKPAPAAGPEPRRSFAGKGRTVFFKELIQETERKGTSRVRAVVWSFVALLVVAAAALWWIGERRVRQAEAALERETAAARSALASAEQRTAELEGALARSEASMRQQLAAGDSLRRAAQAELARLRVQLASASADDGSRRALDSIRAAMTAAEQRAGELEAGLRAVRGVDLAQIAERNQAAVGLVTAFRDGGAYDGTGFVVTSSGYLVTNRHVARPEGREPDSVRVTMADQRIPFRAEVVAVADPYGPDLAVLRLERYQGAFIAAVDWQGNAARQGEPAALIGFPTGIAAALDATSTVRTSMSGGYFSKVTAESIQFDGFTVPGSSGSPLFNASGTAVAVHSRGLREGPGLSFTVPLHLLVPLLPSAARRELGL